MITAMEGQEIPYFVHKRIKYGITQITYLRDDAVVSVRVLVLPRSLGKLWKLFQS